MYWFRRGLIVLALLLIASFIAWFVPRVLDPTSHGPARRARDSLWVSSSPYWIDRQFCRWLSLCGLHHLRRDPAALPSFINITAIEDQVRTELRKRYAEPPLSWEDRTSEDSGTAGTKRFDKKRNVFQRRRILKDVPDYVVEHAPLVHLYSGEQFWPSDIREHVQHMDVLVDEELVNVTDDKLTLDNLHSLNKFDGVVNLHSLDDVETRPTWLHSHDNVPSPFDDDDDDDDDDHIVNGGGPPRGERTTWFDVNKDLPLHRISDPRPLRNAQHQRPLQAKPRRIQRRGHKPDANGYSRAPAVLVLVDKGSGILDAFWFFFYSYNLGQTVLGIRFGNHVGDWEHCMVRFEHGVPRGIFFSEHEGGQAYAWDAVEKRGKRPVIYSAVGSHAMYATPGDHPYVLPFKMLKDVSDKGPLWDPALNNYAYHYNYKLEKHTELDEEAVDAQNRPPSLVPAAKNPHAPTSWFHYNGYWGDRLYTLADMRQWRLFGQYHYVTGPTGPKFKRLGRSKMCQASRCRILYKLDPKQTWY
ncbi:Vacuolar protein sorting-associated protein 62 [Conoideocrella luteorostrata]|uniref:Vacuolar protein sorting-associated protein 62 n=1 Tax=Conoideocrella luteorostrata TaxID=1105319 RepID=A0AAJ0FUY4_9HYPO|nr:Vacuolar protein sorting-associated protein 62 [Conoideocrella luteorostrata]